MTLYVEELLEEGFGKQVMGSAVCGNSQVPRGTEYRVVTNGRAGGGRRVHQCAQNFMRERGMITTIHHDVSHI